MLRDFDARHFALPFDWLITENHEKFAQIFEDDFQYFLEKSYLFPHPDFHCIENRYYEIEFRHDSNFLASESEFNQIQETYQRRIDRLRKIREYPGKVYFLRVALDWRLGISYFHKGDTAITPDHALRLRNALKSFFPSLDFTLIIVNYIEDHDVPIQGIPDVVELKFGIKDKAISYSNLFGILGIPGHF
ncbi:MAG TPA: DUF1796 family putative cysteine peptidase [Chlamydiales bacterium]|nr:DUF1796 family putative cysteine peptidase [Chlamydiales bacterium]